MNNIKLNKQDGFTLLEMVIVIAVIGLLIAISVMNFSGFNDKNEAVVMKNNANMVLDVSRGYLLSTGLPTNQELTEKITKQLNEQGYQDIATNSKYFRVTREEYIPIGMTTKVKEWVVRLTNKVDNTFSFEATIKPERLLVCVEASSSDSDRVNSLLDEGVIDNGDKCR